MLPMQIGPSRSSDWERHTFSLKIFTERWSNLSLLPPLKDEKFAQYVEGLRKYIKDLEVDEDVEWAQPSDGIIVSPWAPPKAIGRHRFSDTSLASTIKSTWENLLSGGDADMIASRYTRLLCIETNEIENVFALDSESLPRLVRLGFYTGAIDRVGAEGVQEPQKIVSILKDLLEGLDFLIDIVENRSQLSEDTICRIHKTIMKSSRIGSHYDGETTIFYLTHGGVYRKRLVSTNLTPETVVQYTHQSKVSPEMKLFVDMSKYLEEKNISPFAMAAWIHAVFARIHPFTDGNGRVSRLLASLPLIRAGYPFMNIRINKWEEYLDALFAAQTTADLQPLMDVIASSMLDSIDYIQSLPPTSPEDKQC